LVEIVWLSDVSRTSDAFAANKDFKEDRVVIGEGTPKWNSVPGEHPEEGRAKSFDLLVVAQDPLPGAVSSGPAEARVNTAVHSRRQKSFQDQIGKGPALVGAGAKVRGKDWEVCGGIEPVERVIEHADYSVCGYGHRWQGSLYLSGYERLGSNGQAPNTVVLQSPYSQTVVAGSRVAIAINIVNIAVRGIDRCVIDATQKRVDRAKLWCRLGAICVGNQNAGRASIQTPRAA
jgi:hypothetical protein